MLSGPVEAALSHFNGTASLEQANSRFWMALHEVEHVFNEGGDMLVSAGVFTESQLVDARQLGSSLDQDHYKG